MKKLVLLLCCLLTIPCMGALSPNLKEWGEGPVQWIMTREEQRAWRQVKTDDEAVSFIDLFWARRDPSPGSAVNENRFEYDMRVKHADESFGERTKRGAMTDRGRVYIVLGPATEMTGTVGQGSSAMASSDASNDLGGAAAVGNRYVWLWEHEDARKFGMPKIEVVFVEDASTRRTQRDPRKADFGRAAPAAIKRSIVSPDLTELPHWAARGGLEPKAPPTVIVFEPGTPSAAPAPSEAAGAAPQVPRNDGPLVASKTPGVTRLTLLQRASIDPRSATDPLAIESEAAFAKGRDGAWAVQVCAATPDVPRLKYMLVIAGPLDGGSKEQRTAQKETRPERMTARPGCYLLQGSAPTSKLAPGRYRLSVLIDDVMTGDLFSVKREFRVE